MMHDWNKEGREAHAAGKPITDCPYPQGSSAHAAWEAGWSRAQVENPKEYDSPIPEASRAAGAEALRNAAQMILDGKLRAVCFATLGVGQDQITYQAGCCAEYGTDVGHMMLAINQHLKCNCGERGCATDAVHTLLEGILRSYTEGTITFGPTGAIVPPAPSTGKVH